MVEQKMSFVVDEDAVSRSALACFFEHNQHFLEENGLSISVVTGVHEVSAKAAGIICIGDIEGAPEEAVQVKCPIRMGRLLDVLLKETESQTITIGAYILDLAQLVLIKAEQQIDLTDKEAALLMKLYEHGGAAVERAELLKDVWEYAEDVDTHTLETHIYRVRQKIEDDPSAPKILLTDGDGYRLAF